jgi:hypothetical protein
MMRTDAGPLESLRPSGYAHTMIDRSLLRRRAR